MVGIIVSRYLGYSGKPWMAAVSLVGGERGDVGWVVPAKENEITTFDTKRIDDIEPSKNI